MGGRMRARDGGGGFSTSAPIEAEHQQWCFKNVAIDPYIFLKKIGYSSVLKFERININCLKFF